MADDDTASSPPPSRPRSGNPSTCLEDWTAPRAIYAIALSFSWVLSVVAATEPVWEEYRGSQHVKQTLWQVCYDNDCRWGEFGHLADCSMASKYRAGRAFAALVCLFLAVIVIVAIARAMLPNVDLRFTYEGSLSGKIYFWSLALTTFFCFLAWPIAFSLYGGPQCHGEASVSSLQYSVLGSCGLFFLNVFIILMLCLVSECLRGRGVFSAASDASYPALA